MRRLLIHGVRAAVAAVILSSALDAGFVATARAAGLNAVESRDGADVWAVGKGGAVYRSLDGGAVWKSAPLGTIDLHAVAATAVCVTIAGDSGASYVSTDAGFTWSAATLGGGANLRAAHATAAGSIWIGGAGGMLIKSTDAGQSWAAKTSGTSAEIRAIQFTGESAGWACGANGTLLRTLDGGESWTASNPFSVSRTLNDIAVSGANVSVAGAEAFFATSTNGGASWTEHDLRIVSRSDVNGVAALDDGRIFLCGGGGYLRASSDGGASWTFPLHSIVSGLSDIHFAGASLGWACAELSDNVLRTTDGGASWTAPGGAAFTYLWSKKKGVTGVDVRGNTFDIDPFNRDKLYVTMGNAVYASWNRGNNWPQIATIGGGGSKSNAFYVSRTDTLTWVAAAQDPDRITRTTDGGATWTTTLSRAFGEYGVPLERDPNIPEHLYFGPNDGRFYKSTNFGLTWTEHSNPAFRSPCDIVVVPDTTGLIYVGDGTTGTGIGQLFRSTDGGLSFTLIFNGNGSEIPMINASELDNRIAYATNWGSGGVRRTGDYGLNWPQVATTTSAWGVDIAKDDPHVVMYGLYDGGPNYVSVDDGASFTTALVSNSSNYGLLVYDRGTWLALHSNGVHKSVITQPGMPVDNAELLTVVTPNGGETWQYNEVRTITWTSQNLAVVRIEYSVDGGAWQTIAASTSGPAGAYPWVVPALSSTNVRVRVSDANDAAPLDESNAAFTVATSAIASTRASLDYGSVPVGAVKQDTLRILNGGTAPLVITDVSTAGGASFAKSSASVFTPKRTSFTIAAGASDTLAVVFSPGAEVAYLDTLLIECNAPSSPLAIPLSGTGVALVSVESASPERFELFDTAPNPFGAGGTAISYAIPRESDVRLAVYNAAGQEVATLVAGRQSPGRYVVRFPNPSANGSAVAGGVASGVYFYTLRAGDFAETKRMVLVR
ncbi:MAG: YCF48-related protein [bacterium]